MPIRFRKRKSVKSRLIDIAFGYAQDAGLTSLRSYIYYNALNFFAILGTFAFAVSLALGILFITSYVTTSLISPIRQRKYCMGCSSL